MTGMAPKNCKVPACEGVFPFKCHNRTCPNKGAIQSSEDLVLLQMVNPEKADLHMIGGKPDKPSSPARPPARSTVYGLGTPLVRCGRRHQAFYSFFLL